MNFISYAQNFEDVMLWRALKHIETGFYIDVGANDPKFDSVTKAFYDLGWRGINIEPVPQWFQRLQESRSRDINLQLAVGSKPGEITLFDIPDTGLSTAMKGFAERHEAEHGYQSEKLKVPLDTLTNLCERYHMAPVHFLKIDVEGMEKAVLEGIEFTKVRPWIVLVESTLPNRQEECHGEWEPILVGAGYQYAYFDGINRFYVAEEHPELMGAFEVPPNVFDDFILVGQVDENKRTQVAETKLKKFEGLAAEAHATAMIAETEAAEAKARADVAETKAGDAESKVAEAEAKVAEAEAKAAEAEARDEFQKTLLVAINNSTSWRVTSPLRYFGQLVKKNQISIVHEKFRVFFEHASLYIRRRPRLNRLVLKGLERLTNLKARLVGISMQPMSTKPSNFQPVPDDRANLNPRATQIYLDLRAAIERAKKERC